MAEVCLIDLLHYPGSRMPEEYDPHLAAETIEGRLSEWVYAEELGFDGVFLTEHHFTAYNLTPSPNVLLAALAQRTERMRLGVMANIVPFHQPLRLAEECAMLDLLTEGRLEIGLGRGVDEQEFVRLKMPREQARPRFEEGVDLMVKAWSQQRFAHKGEYYEVAEGSTIYPRPLQQPYPKVWITATSPQTIEWAGRQGHAMSSILFTAEQTRAAFERFRGAAQDAGHSATGNDFMFGRHIVVAETTAEARKIARGNFEIFMRLLKEQAVPDSLDDLPEDYAYYKEFFAPFQGDVTDVTFDALCETGLLLVGDPERVRGQLLEQLDIVGCDQFLAFMRFGYISDEEARRSEELFAQEVLPAVQALDRASA